MADRTRTLIRNVIHDGRRTNILIDGNRFASLDAAADAPAGRVIEAAGKAILPSFFNTHTHAAMTLLRGCADDLPLFTWLNDHIWPREAKLTPEDIDIGNRFAILEMIRTGTTFFCDMYWESGLMLKAAEEMGIRAAVAYSLMDRQSEDHIASDLAAVKAFRDPTGGRLQVLPGPHAVYTVGPKLLVRCAEAAKDAGLMLTIHLAETAQEVSDCVKAYGTTPVRLLHRLGVLGPNLVAAHVVHVDDEEIEILAGTRTVISHNPCSNMKLSSGVCRTSDMARAGCRITLGTDGTASNNNLDMREEMKFAALLAKCHGTPESAPAGEVLKWATRNGAEAFGIDAGVIAEGKLADAILVDLGNVSLTPCHNLVSNWVYAAGSSAIDTVICDGRVLMENRRIPGEEDILAAAREAAKRFT